MSAQLTTPTVLSLASKLSTPALLRLAMAAVAVLALLFFLAVRSGVKKHHAAMGTIGKDAAPSILAAQHIRANLADMHSNAANVLLHKPGKGESAWKDFEKRRLEATEGILTAAANITYDEDERKPLRQLLNELGRYEAAIAEAFVLHRRDEADFIKSHRAADRIMSESILPAADKLDQVNRDAMDRAYGGVRAASLGAIFLVFLAGAALVGALALIQMFLFRRMRRLLNPGLAAATVLALGFLLYVLVAFIGQRGALKTAKEDAFHSIHDLWRARAEAYDGNGDESRWLLDRQQAAAYDSAFRAKEARLMKPPEGMSRKEVLAAVQRGSVPQGFKGYLADELRNITFEGERKAAVASLETFINYVDIDARIRELETKGRHAEAVALCLGERPGESNWAFARFDEALGKTIAINQKVFDETVKQSLDELTPFDVTAPLAALVVAGLAVAGLWPRLREYAAG